MAVAKEQIRQIINADSRLLFFVHAPHDTRLT